MIKFNQFNEFFLELWPFAMFGHLLHSISLETCMLMF